MAGFVSFVGAGPWDPELLTLAGQRRLRRAEVVIADYLANPNLLLHCPPSAEIVQRIRGSSGGPRLRQPELNALMLEHAKAGKYVVRLKGGDPCMFGRGAEEAQVLHEAGIGFEFIPGVSSPIAAPEAAGIPVTHRDHTPAVTFVSGYEAYDKAGLHVEWQHLARSAGTLVLMMSVKNARENARRLVEAGRDAQTPAAVIRWGTRGLQQTIVGTLTTIADQIDHAGIRAPSVLVVGNVVQLRDKLAWVETRPLFGRRVVLTRAAHQLESLSLELDQRGADVAAFPCVRIDPPADPTAFDDALRELPSSDGLILSSTNGVEAFFDALPRLGLDVRALAGKCVAVIGHSTAERCRSRGIEPDLVPEAQRSEGLAEALRERGIASGSFIHVRADKGRSVLQDAIEAAGGRYLLAVGYAIGRPKIPETVVRSLLPPREGGEGIDAISFASVQTARHFVASVDEWLGEGAALAKLASTKVISIGPATTRGLGSMGIAVATTAEQPDEGSLVAAIEATLAS